MGRWGAVPGTPGCCAYCCCCLKTFHFHLRAGSLPHNLHFCCSPWCHQGPGFLGGSWRGCSIPVRHQDVPVTEEWGNYDSLEADRWDIGPHMSWYLGRLGSLGLAAIPSLSFHQGADGQYESLIQPCTSLSGPCGKGAETREPGSEGIQPELWVGQPQDTMPLPSYQSLHIVHRVSRLAALQCLCGQGPAALLGCLMHMGS